MAFAVALQLLAGRSPLTLPLARHNVTVDVLVGLLVGQAAATAVWLGVPWTVWRTTRSAMQLTFAIGALAALSVVVIGLAIGTINGVGLALPWLTSAGLAWVGIALTGNLGTSWLLPLGLTMCSLVAPVVSLPPLWAGVYVAAWYSSPPYDIFLLPGVLTVVALILCGTRLPRRR